MSRITYNLARNDEGANITIYGLETGIEVVSSDAPYFTEVSGLLHDAFVNGTDVDAEQLALMLAPAKMAATLFQPLSERISVKDNRIYYDGDEIHNSLTEQVVTFMIEGEDFGPLVAYLDRVMANPIRHSRDQSYRWLSRQRLTITPEGMVIGYKGVKEREPEVGEYGWNDGADSQDPIWFATTSGHAIVNGEDYNGRTPYPVGATVIMPRSEVVHDPYDSCSYGLHVGTYSYARGFGDKVIEVLVDPRDIVSVPNGEDDKMRVCRLQVLGEAEGKDPSLVRVFKTWVDEPDHLDAEDSVVADEDEEYEGYDPDFDPLLDDEKESDPIVDSPFDLVLPDLDFSYGRMPTVREFAEAQVRARVRRQNLSKWITKVLGWTQVPDTDGKSRDDWRVTDAYARQSPVTHPDQPYVMGD